MILNFPKKIGGMRGLEVWENSGIGYKLIISNKRSNIFFLISGTNIYFYFLSEIFLWDSKLKKLVRLAY